MKEKKQLLITSNERVDFENRINEHFEMGWTLTPESLIGTVSTSVAEIDSKWGYRAEINTEERWAAVLEYIEE